MSNILGQRFGNDVMGNNRLQRGSFFGSPKSLAGLTLWLTPTVGLYQDSAKTTPVTSDGDPVGAWADQSGAGNDFIMATASRRPTYKVNQQNGLPGIQADGVDDTLWTSNNMTSFSLKAGTIFIVAKANSVSSMAMFSLYQSAGNAAPWEFGYTNFSSQTFWYDGTSSQNPSSGLSATTAYIHTILRSAATTVKAYKNGSLSATLTVANTQPDPGHIKLFSSSFYLNTASEQFSGNAYEVIYYDRALSTAEIAKVHTYLKARWAL